jgi:hypothetical protein
MKNQPCPGCGNKRPKISTMCIELPNGEYYDRQEGWLACTKCGLQGPKKSWNSKHPLIRLPDRDIKFLLFCMGQAAGLAQHFKGRAHFVDRSSVRIIKHLPPK